MPSVHRGLRARVALGVVASILALAGSAAATAVGDGRYRFDTTPGRLSKHVVPSRYVLALTLDPAQDVFTGDARIAVHVRQPTDAIELHAWQLTATRAELLAGGVARALQVTPQPESQTWRLTPTDGQPIAAGAHTLRIGYTGKVNVAGEGLYAVPFETKQGKQRMLATQLEAISARKLFPAFDEPAFRAVFDITVRAPRRYDVVSNMPRSARRVQGGEAEHRFASTPAMPSYLVAVAVGQFDVLEGRAAGVPLRIYTAPGKREQARTAMRITQQVLPHYTKYFGVPYALPKLDQFAVPGVRWGAMEDWGLISYIEDGLLMDPRRSSPKTERDIYFFVAHEVAHQWFGNLVTAASWDEIWLNEAFATWLEGRTTDHFNPAWRMPLERRIKLDEAMAIDAGTATRAIRSGPVRETAVFDVFDDITYDKGGAVLSMLEQLVGPDRFQRGLADYMRGQRLSNATAVDLWHYIGRAAGRTDGPAVTDVAASWTDRPGFPLVQAASRCDGAQQVLTLTQSRYRQAGPSAAAPAEPPWLIPLRYTRGAEARTVLFDTKQRSVVIGACSDVPVLVNAGGRGYYRVAYDDATRRALTQRYAALPEADRVALLSDTFALVQTGRLPLQAYLALLEALPQVTDDSRSVLWSVADTQLRFLDIAFAGLPAQAQLRATGRRVMAPLLARLTWQPRPGESAQTAELRGTLIEMLARCDDAPTIAAALRAFDADDAGTRRLPPALREPVIEATGLHADRARFDRLLARLKAADSEEERWILVRALASGRDAQRAGELLALSLSGSVPANIASDLPAQVARRSPFGDQAYRYTVEHWGALAQLTGQWGRQFLLPKAAAGYSDAAQADRLVEDQRRLAGPDGAANAAQEAERIRLRASTRAHAAPALDGSAGL